MDNRKLAPVLFATTLAIASITAAFAADKATLTDTNTKNVTPTQSKKTPLDTQKLVDMHFQAMIRPTAGSDSFIWMEAVPGYVEDNDGNLKYGPGIMFRTCDLDSIKVQGGGGPGKQQVSADSIEQKLESPSQMLIDAKVAINPRKCKPVMDEADIFPADDVLKRSGRLKEIVITVGRIAIDTTAITVGAVTSTAFSWAKPIEWGAGIVAAKTFSSLFADKPFPEFENEIRLRGAQERVLDIRKRYNANPDGFYITVRVPKIKYPELVAGLTGELDDIHNHYCKRSTSKHSNALCDQWDESSRNRTNLYVKPAGDVPPAPDPIDKFRGKIQPAAPVAGHDQNPTSENITPDSGFPRGEMAITIPFDDSSNGDRAVGL